MTRASRPSPASAGAGELCPLASDVAGVAPGQRVTAIIRRCAERRRVSAADILGHTRRAHVVRARWEAIKLVAQAFPEFSTTRLGEIFNRDHTSILYALGRLSSAKKQNRRAAQ